MIKLLIRLWRTSHVSYGSFYQVSFKILQNWRQTSKYAKNALKITREKFELHLERRQRIRRIQAFSLELVYNGVPISFSGSDSISFLSGNFGVLLIYFFQSEAPAQTQFELHRRCSGNQAMQLQTEGKKEKMLDCVGEGLCASYICPIPTMRPLDALWVR